MRSRDTSNNAPSISSHRSELSATVINTPSTPGFLITPRNAVPTPFGSAFNSAAQNAEDDLDNPVQGWPQVAMLMAKTPDFASFSRFRDLNIKSLLYYQAELTRLRKKLHEEELEDARRGDAEASKYARRADMLINSEEPNDSQWELVKQIRVVLKEYNEALLQYSQICALPEPEAHNMKSLRKWLRDKKGGNMSIGGSGEECTWGYLYETEEETTSLKWQFVKLIWALIWCQPAPKDDLDLVSTVPPRKIDGFSRWVGSRFIPFYANYQRYKHLQKKRASSNVTDEVKTYAETNSNALPPKPKPSREFYKETLATYSEKSILRFTSAISTIVACLLPTVAITVLSQISGIRNLLLCIAGFAIIFAAGLIFLTNGTASRIDIFTATAAFSAVLVVFMSNPQVQLQVYTGTVPS